MTNKTNQIQADGDKSFHDYILDKNTFTLTTKTKIVVILYIIFPSWWHAWPQWLLLLQLLTIIIMLVHLLFIYALISLKESSQFFQPVLNQYSGAHINIDQKIFFIVSDGEQNPKEWIHEDLCSTSKAKPIFKCSYLNKWIKYINCSIDTNIYNYW